MIKLNLRLILIFLEISVIPLFLISYLAVFHTKKMITEATLSQLEQVVAVNESKLKVVLAENKSVVDSYVSASDLTQASTSSRLQVKASSDSLNKLLDEIRLKVDGLTNISVIDQNGKIVSSSDQIRVGEVFDSIKDLTYRDPLGSQIFAQNQNKDGEIVHEFILDNNTLKLVSVKNTGRQDQPVSFVVVQRSGDYVLGLFEDYVGFGNSFEFILVNRDKYGNAVFVTPSKFDQAGPLTKTTPGDDLRYSTTLALSGQEKKIEDSSDWRGKHVLSATRFVDETGWGLIAQKDKDETYLPIAKLTSLLAVLAVVSVIIIVLISLSAATSIVAPINRLINITGKISGGDLSQRAIVESKDEIGLLELAFNDMASKLKESYEGLEHKVAERTRELEMIRKNLEVANANLRELDKLKDEFVSVASHELRTPMTAIRGLISMILEGDYGAVNANLKMPLADISKSTQRLIILVNDILNVSRIETGKLKFALTYFDIGPVVMEMGEQLMPIAIEKGLSLQVTKSPSSVVQADKDKVREILNNLIGNALKFTEVGSVSVSWLTDADEVKVFIRDTGMGISASEQLKLFGKFKQITTQQVGKPSGSGLGLYISRELARKMGGELWIEESKLRQGSTFAFSLPKADSQMARMVAEKIMRENKPDSV